MGELAIADAVTINGPGAGLLTIDASGNDSTPLSTLADGDATNDGDGSRVFNVDDGSAALINVEIHGVTLAGGDAAGDGGGVFSKENLTLADSVVRDNIGAHGGGIHSSVGTLSVERSVVRGNSAFFDGGGIAGLDGVIVVTESTISGNTTKESGGGIEAYLSDLSVTASTISGNAAGFDGGGIDAVAASVQISRSTISDNEAGRHGGGIVGGLTAASQSTVVLTQVTISGNRAKGMGGGIVGGSLTTILHSTIAENVADFDGSGDGFGGGVSGGFGITAQHSIVANNLNFDVPDDWASEQMPNVDFSLIEHVTGIHPIVGVGNILGQDPLLGPLTDNGGPTLTYALLAGSPAIEAGDPAAIAGEGGVPDFDQRGEPFGRVADGDEPDDIAIDIGAYERQFGETYTFVVDTLVDESDGDYSFGDFSLREAIELANANPGADSISFAPALTANGPATILLSMLGDESERGRAALLISEGVTITGPGAALLTLDASGIDLTPEEDNGDGGRVLTIYDRTNSSSQQTVIQGLTITGGDGGFNGSVNANGGGIRVFNMQLVLRESTVSGNHAQGEGGGIYSFADGQPGHTLIERSTIASNHAGGGGGGISARNGLDFGTIVRDSLIADNRSEYHGGGIFAISSQNIPFLLEGSTVSGNIALDGGGISLGYSATGTILRHSTITQNSAASAGGTGGVLGGRGAATLSHVIVAGNQEAAGLASDLGRDPVYVDPPSSFAIDHSLIGVNDDSGYAEAPVGSPDANGNLIGGIVTGIIVPGLEPLTYNGGPTRTHALLPGSPAIDAGDPAAVAGIGGVPEFDQRGTPWSRVFNGDDVPEARIDIGAVEWQLNPLPGDYNFNGVVDAADYSIWRNTRGSFDDLRADGSSASTPGAPDGIVDQHDYAFWKANFGNVYVPEQGAGSVEVLQLNALFREPVSQPPALPGVLALQFEYASPPRVTRTLVGRPAAADEPVRLMEHDDALVALLAQRGRSATVADHDVDFKRGECDDEEADAKPLDEAFAALALWP